MLSIKAKPRNKNLKLEALRQSGGVPAVFYGASKSTTEIEIPMMDFKKIWREAGESSAVKIELPDAKIDALIHEVQVDPVRGEPLHVDFLAIDMNKKIRVKIPVVFEGISAAVKNGVGNLVKVLHEVEIEALPADLPHELLADLAKLETLNDQIFVSDLKIPSRVEIINTSTDVVASIVEQVEEKEEPVEPVDLSQIEVEKKGKKEEEGEAPVGGTPENTETK